VAGITEPHHPRIPKLLHQSWRDGGFPKTLFNWRWQQGLLDLNPEWRLMKWTDETSRALIAEHYSWFLPTYDAYPSYIQRCDASRYFIVYHHGGVYADLDIECSKPFAPVLGAHRAVFSYKQGRNLSRGLVNALFATERHHPLWEHVFALLSNRSALGAAASTHVDVIFSTGPGLLREAIMMLQSRRELHDLGIELLDASVWHPVMPEQKRGRDQRNFAPCVEGR
jgi:mannosyltransferase OCH1-like enzyme